jgi:hypothetical protein
MTGQWLARFRRWTGEAGSSESVVAPPSTFPIPMESDLARRLLYVPGDLVLATWRALRPTSEAGCEGVVFWAAPKEMYRSSVAVVTTVVAPAQRVGPGRFELASEGVRAMGAVLRRQGLVNLVQVHTHPGAGVGHSPWDDLHAFSQREGTLSVVWPHYGRDVPPVSAWGVHVRLSGSWRRLSTPAASERLRILPTTLDLRTQLEWLNPAEVEK